jgi:hypothetical protein
VGSQTTRRLGTACRIYKNAADEVIGIDSVEVVVDEVRINKELFHLSVNTINVKRTLLHLTAGASRVISKVQMMGSYDELEENAGNFFVLRWLPPPNLNQTTVEISLEGRVAILGETI